MKMEELKQFFEKYKQTIHKKLGKVERTEGKQVVIPGDIGTNSRNIHKTMPKRTKAYVDQSRSNDASKSFEQSST